VDTPSKNRIGERFPASLGTAVGPFLTLGLQTAISVAAFFFLGQWLDGKFGTSPWLMITGAVVGIAGALLYFIRTVTRLAREQDEEAAAGNKKQASHES
jgi:ATP synthase protein I